MVSVFIVCISLSLLTLLAVADILFLISEGAEDLQDAIARICEQWWKLDLQGKETLVPNTICYLLIRSLGEKSTGMAQP